MQYRMKQKKFNPYKEPAKPALKQGRGPKKYLDWFENHRLRVQSPYRASFLHKLPENSARMPYASAQTRPSHPTFLPARKLTQGVVSSVAGIFFYDPNAPLPNLGIRREKPRKQKTPKRAPES